jgi:hypothetical protein
MCDESTQIFNRALKGICLKNTHELSLMTADHLKLIVLKVFGEFLFLFGLLAWVYGILVQLIHPEWLPLSLSHLIQWIRVDTFTIISFVVAAIGFLTWRLAKELLILIKRTQ